MPALLVDRSHAWLERGRVALRRPSRFALVGGVCAALQLIGLTALVRLGLPHVLANFVALALATQVNFLLSARVIWPDRPTSLRQPREFLRRLLAFNVMCAGTLAINEGVFAASDRVAPYLLAAALGAGVAAPLNYLCSNYGVFRARRPAAAPAAR
jgi:putative flippase GtrA